MHFNFLQFYFDLAFNNEVNNIQSRFIGNKELLKGDSTYLAEDETYIIELGDPSESKTIYITREIYLQDILDVKKKELYVNLSNHINKLKETDKKDTLVSFFGDFLMIYNKAESQQEEKYFTQIINDLEVIIKDLKIFYQNIVEHHKFYNKVVIQNNTLSYFQYKELPVVFFEKLYDITIQLDLIDDIEIEERTFIDLLTLPKSKSDIKVSFIKPNPIVAYYLKQIEPFFNNFNAITVEKSQSFINKQGKPLKSTDLYAALSRGKKSNEEYFKKIDSLINPLKKEFLK